MGEVDIHGEEGLHEKEANFELIKLDTIDDDPSLIIQEKEAKIRDLQANLERSKFFITFLKQENQQLKTKHFIDEVKCIKAQREVEKAKALLEETLEKYGEPDDEED